jgi:hypothetical protein
MTKIVDIEPPTDKEMPDIRIIYDYDDFIDELRDLYNQVETTVNQRRAEYEYRQWEAPARIKFEEIDLHSLTSRMLSVHKTLQSKAHLRILNRGNSQEDARKARFVAIAGICELIKDEFVGKFWDVHRRVIGWGPDSTVYDWIWESGFKEQGIELLISHYRREFVQTLVLESGVPKNRVHDIIEFFVIYWRYLNNIEDVENLIDKIILGEYPLDNIPAAQKRSLTELCVHASDFTKAFALAVDKLSRIFKYIESSDEIYHGEIEKYIDLIFRKTGINPLEILRGEEQLKKIYRLILGVITPQKLERILKTKPIGTKIRKADNQLVRIDTYKEIQYGEHILDGARFTCVPNTCLQLADLQNLEFDTVVHLGTGVLLKSKSKIKAIINRRNRPDLVRSFFAPNFEAYIFYMEQSPAMTIALRTENGKVDERLTAPEGFECNSFLHYSGNLRKNIHSIYASISSCRIMSDEHGGLKLALKSGISPEPVSVINLNSDGYGYCSERSVPIKEPTPCNIRFRVTRIDSDETVSVNGKMIESYCEVAPAILFSPYYGRQFPLVSSGNKIRYGGKKFVLYAADSDSGTLAFSNMSEIGTSVQGAYSVRILAWENTSAPCEIRYILGEEVFSWCFDRYLHFNLYVRKVHDCKVDNLTLGSLQGVSVEDFEITVNPVPIDEIRNKLIWGLTINNGTPLTVPYTRGPVGTIEGPSIKFSRESINDLIGMAGYKTSNKENALIEISLGIQDHIFSHVKFWVFPDVQITMHENLRQGSDAYANARSGNSYFNNIALKDSRGNTKVPSLCQYYEKLWKAVEHPFYGKLDLEEYGTVLDICVIPKAFGFRFGNIKTGVDEPPRNLMKWETSNFDLLVLSDDPGRPVVFVNSQESGLHFTESGIVRFANLIDLPGLLKSENIVNCLAGNYTADFTILYHLTVLKAEFHMIHGSIMGKISFNGPAGFVIEVAVFKNPGDTYEHKIAGCRVVSDGNEHIDHPLEVPLTISNSQHKDGFYVRLYFSESGGSQTSGAHEFGESWHVDTELRQPGVDDYEYFITKARIAMEDNKVFQANRFIELAMKNAPAGDLNMLLDLKKKNDIKRIGITIKSLAVQSLRVLNKEFLLDLDES